MKKIQKRTGELVPFDASKIVKAIIKAMRHGSGIVDIEVAQLIASKITMSLRDNWWGDMTPTISDIEAMVFHELTLIGHHQTAIIESVHPWITASCSDNFLMSFPNNS